MTTLQGDNGKTMKYTFSRLVHEIDRVTYIPEMPMIVCENKKDAEYIQSKISEAVSEACKKLLKE